MASKSDWQPWFAASLLFLLGWLWRDPPTMFYNYLGLGRFIDGLPKIGLDGFAAIAIAAVPLFLGAAAWLVWMGHKRNRWGVLAYSLLIVPSSLLEASFGKDLEFYSLSGWNWLNAAIASLLAYASLAGLTYLVDRFRSSRAERRSDIRFS